MKSLEYYNSLSVEELGKELKSLSLSELDIVSELFRKQGEERIQALRALPLFSRLELLTGVLLLESLLAKACCDYAFLVYLFQ
jgi:hypothetical protein